MENQNHHNNNIAMADVNFRGQAHDCPTPDSAFQILEQQRQARLAAVDAFEAQALHSDPAVVEHIRQHTLARLQGLEQDIRSNNYLQRQNDTSVIYKGQTFNFATAEAAEQFAEKRRRDALANLDFYRQQTIRGDGQVFQPERLQAVAASKLQRKHLRANAPLP